MKLHMFHRGIRAAAALLIALQAPAGIWAAGSRRHSQRRITSQANTLPLGKLEDGLRLPAQNNSSPLYLPAPAAHTPATSGQTSNPSDTTAKISVDDNAHLGTDSTARPIINGRSVDGEVFADETAPQANLVSQTGPPQTAPENTVNELQEQLVQAAGGPESAPAALKKKPRSLLRRFLTRLFDGTLGRKAHPVSAIPMERASIGAIALAADPAEEPRPRYSPPSPAIQSFVAPNELSPQLAVSLLQRAPPGAYVAIGSERGFIGAANTPGVDRLDLIDNDEQVLFFNRLNIALLELAADGNREEYLRLRLRSTHDEWLALLRGREVSAESRELLENHEAFQWLETVRPGSGNNRFEWNALHEMAGIKSYERGGFEEAVYLHNDEGFSRIQRLAKAGAIHVHSVDLAYPSSVDSFVRGLRRDGAYIGVLDVSNVWHGMFAGRFNTGRFVDALDTQLYEDSLVLVTDSRDLPSMFQKGAHHPDRPWNYVYRAYTKRYLRGKKRSILGFLFGRFIRLGAKDFIVNDRPQRAPPPLIQTEPEIPWERIAEENDVVLWGEFHASIDAASSLTQQLSRIKKAGITHIGIEALDHTFQDTLDRFIRKEIDELPAGLLTEVFTYNGNTHKSNAYEALLWEARKLGIRIIALDMAEEEMRARLNERIKRYTGEEVDIGAATAMARAKRGYRPGFSEAVAEVVINDRNDFMAARMNEALSDGGKAIGFVGNGHIEIPGSLINSSLSSEPRSRLTLADLLRVSEGEYRVHSIFTEGGSGTHYQKQNIFPLGALRFKWIYSLTGGSPVFAQTSPTTAVYYMGIVPFYVLLERWLRTTISAIYRSWLYLQSLLQRPKLAGWPNIGISPEKPALIVVHGLKRTFNDQTFYDESEAAKDGINEAVRRYKAQGWSVIYIDDMDPRENYMEDNQPDARYRSQGYGSLVRDMPAQDICMAGGYTHGCMMGAAIDALHSSISRRLRENPHGQSTVDFRIAVDGAYQEKTGGGSWTLEDKIVEEGYEMLNNILREIGENLWRNQNIPVEILLDRNGRELVPVWSAPPMPYRARVVVRLTRSTDL